MHDDVRAAVAYARRRPDWLRTALLGSLLVAASDGLVPAILLSGNAVRVLRAGRTDEPPGVGDPGALVGDGCRLVGVTAGYNALPATLAFVSLRRSGTIGIGPVVGIPPQVGSSERSSGQFRSSGGRSPPRRPSTPASRRRVRWHCGWIARLSGPGPAGVGGCR